MSKKEIKNGYIDDGSWVIVNFSSSIISSDTSTRKKSILLFIVKTEIYTCTCTYMIYILVHKERMSDAFLPPPHHPF